MPLSENDVSGEVFRLLMKAIAPRNKAGDGDANSKKFRRSFSVIETPKALAGSVRPDSNSFTSFIPSQNQEFSTIIRCHNDIVTAPPRCAQKDRNI